MDPYPPVDGSSTSESSTSGPLSSVLSSTLSSVASKSSYPTADAGVDETESRSLPTGAIAGGSVGGFVLLCAIAVIVWLVWRHVTRSNEQHNKESRTSAIGPLVSGRAPGDKIHNDSAPSEAATMAGPGQSMFSNVVLFSLRALRTNANQTHSRVYQRI